MTPVGARKLESKFAQDSHFLRVKRREWKMSSVGHSKGLDVSAEILPFLMIFASN